MVVDKIMSFLVFSAETNDSTGSLRDGSVHFFEKLSGSSLFQSDFFKLKNYIENGLRIMKTIHFEFDFFGPLFLI